MRLRRALIPNRETLRTDLLAGVPGAISSVPDGMAAATLAGVNPMAGLYASIAGPIVGGLTSSTRRMIITTTSAAALAAGSALAPVDTAERGEALVLLTVLTGGFMILAGVLRLGRYTRFVSHSVMLGFLTGIAVNIICGQLADLTGAPARGSRNIVRALDVIAHPGRFHWPTLAVGLSALGILVVLARTRLATVGALVALVVPTLAAWLQGADVALVEDSGAISAGLPALTLPRLDTLSGSLVSGAAAIAAIVLVQGAGVAESAPNRTGRSNANQDFVAQGLGNVASGMLRGLPVGGSVGQTALNVSAGGRSRWSAIFTGLWMLVIVVAFGSVVGKVAIPTLAAVLIFAALGALRPATIATVLHAGPISRIALVSTFAATLLLPVAAAVGLGVVVSLLLQLNQEAIDLSVVQVTAGPGGRLEERPVPGALPDEAVTVLVVYGSLFYAGARTLQSVLPDPSGAVRPAVVLRLRGRTTLGATFFSVIGDYARRLDAVGGRLYLSGVHPDLDRRFDDIGTSWPGPVRLFPATELLGESTLTAVDHANAWLVRPDDPPAT